jgi:hypothetical protein
MFVLLPNSYVKPNHLITFIKKWSLSQARWLMLIILATQEVKNGSIAVQGQSWQKVQEIPFFTS